MARYALNGKVALVTGGARGIGFATARALAARGAAVAVVDLERDSVQRAVEQLDGARALGLAADVSDRGAMQQAVGETVERLGGLDVVVANAGIASRPATLRAIPSETAQRVLDVNLMGVYRTVDAALPQIVERRGHIVLISSIYAFINGVGAVPYAMSKAAVEQLGRALRVELVRHGAGATVAYFGFIDTEMVHRAIDSDPIALELMGSFPAPLRKREPATAAAEGIARGIERRAPRVIVPRRWQAVFALRGILGPLMDAQLERDAESQASVAKLDARAGEDQPTTA